MRFIMFLILSAMFSFAMSADAVAASAKVVGTVDGLNGIVKISREGSVKKINVLKGTKIQKGDLVTTSSSATALLKLVDGSNVVLDKSSSILFANINQAEQKSGSVYYKITSRSANNSLDVKTPFAIIGIKGTTFIVNSDEGDKSIALKEGKIGIASMKEEFELYRKKVLEEFNNYKNQQEAAYQQYLRELAGEKPQIVKEFDLNAGNKVSFNEKKVVESSFNGDTNASFNHFDDIIKSMK
jgi:hypothetical protein